MTMDEPQTVIISESMLDVCTSLITIAVDSIYKVPNAQTDLTNTESALYSINYFLRILQVVFIKAKTEQGKCPQNVIDSTSTLLSKVERDLKERIPDINDVDSVAYSIYTCVCTIKNYFSHLKTPEQPIQQIARVSFKLDEDEKSS